jgi:anti-anti-sigma factor
MKLSLTITKTPRSACLRVTGDLDYLTIDELVDAVSQILGQQGDLANLHLDFGGLAFLDSAALSGLLLIHRRTAAAEVALHLDHRPAFLDRVLHVTGLFAHFVPSQAEAESADSARLDPANESRVR